MLLAAADIGEELMHHIADQRWPGCQVHVLGMTITWMSASIATMLLVALLLVAVLVPMARRWRRLPKGGQGFIEVLVVFVRDVVARPALGEKTYAFLPYLVTMFFFVLAMNLAGLVPLQPILSAAGLGDFKIGGSATGVLTACGGLACLTLLTIVILGLRAAVKSAHEHRHWPLWLCIPLSPVLWVMSLSPKIPGPVGKVLLVPLALLELQGALIKCFVLMVRLFANMMAGHTLLAVLTLFTLATAKGALQQSMLYMGATAVCVLGAAAICLMELLVAALQAYIFTFLTAVFLGMYVEPAH
jgi:F-type H+-transporting ATPase subunit a